MLGKISKAIKANRIFRFLIIPLIDKRIPFKFHRLFNRAFHFKLRNHDTVQMYPIGQIALGIFSRRFEKQEVEIFQRIIKPGMIIIDAGANIGLYSLIASKSIGPTGRVISFEPSKETYQRLLDNITLNGFSNITAMNIGLGDRENEKLVLRQDVGFGDAERYLFPYNKTPNRKLLNVNVLQIEEEIDCDTLDNCLENLHINKIDFLKIDTEGYEYYILQGAKKILRSSPEIVILMECTSLGTARASTTQQKVFMILKEFELRIFYWNQELKDFCEDETGILQAGDLWICRNKTQLTF